MSDFDKEAEREKLRERFEEEEADRKHTQQMSELLLKGATMTNAHCEACGDPVFRYDGQTFCPTCQSSAAEQGQQAGGQTGAEGGQQSGGQTQAGSSQDVADSAADAGSESPHEQGGAHADAAGSGAASQRGVARPGAPQSAGGEPQATPDRAASDRAPSEDAGSPAAVGERATTPGDGDVAEAAAALRTTLTKFSRKAADTDDPGRAREYLAAAREAAEALDALPY